MPGGNCICGVAVVEVAAVVGRGLVFVLVLDAGGVVVAGGVAAVIVGRVGAAGPVEVWVGVALMGACTERETTSL